MIRTSSHGRILNRLHNFVNKVATSPSYRWRLHYSPQETLAESDMDGVLAPTQLVLADESINIHFDEEIIFGFRAPLDDVAPAQDVRLLTYGVKPMALVYGPDETMRNLGWWAEQRSLIALLSPYEYIPVYDAGKGRYPNTVYRQQLGDSASGGWRCLIVAVDENRALPGWLALLFKWDAFLGRLLGYPQCCTTAFDERWSLAAKTYQGDLVTLTLLASGIGPFDWRANIFGRYFGYQLVHHFPCRFTCMDTLRLAQRYEAALKDNEPQYVSKLATILSAPVFYTDYAGVFSFPDGRVHVMGNDYILHYDPQRMLATEPDGSLAQTLWSLDRIVTSIEEGTLRIGQEGAVGYLIRFNEER